MEVRCPAAGVLGPARPGSMGPELDFTGAVSCVRAARASVLSEDQLFTVREVPVASAPAKVRFIRGPRMRHAGCGMRHGPFTANHIYEMTLRHFWTHHLTPQRGRRGASTPP